MTKKNQLQKFCLTLFSKKNKKGLLKICSNVYRMRFSEQNFHSGTLSNHFYHLQQKNLLTYSHQNGCKKKEKRWI